MKKEIKHFNINDIKGSDFLNNLTFEELNVLSDDIRKYIIDIISKNGGHLSSNLGVVESTIALFRCFNFPKDKVIFDVGHQSYTYKILSGRSLESLRKKDGVSGFQKIDESDYDCYECGHSSTSISAAMGMAYARDLKHEDNEIIAFIGDASIANGLSFEALNNISKNKNKIIIVLNDNEMAISESDGALAKAFRKITYSNFYLKSKNVYSKMLKSNKFGSFIYNKTSNFKNWIKRHLIKINPFDFLNLKYIGVIDGHNIKSLEKAFNKAKSLTSSVIIHIKTIKGKGLSYTEKDKLGLYHGVGKFNVNNGQIYKNADNVSWSQYFANYLDKVMENNDNVITITPATGLGSCLSKIQEKYPNRFIDVGISEEHATILSAGLARNDMHPVISMYSTFMQRAYDEISHDLARMNLNATLLVDRAGLVGEDGNTHQGLYDVAYLSSIPNTTITMPSHPNQIMSLLNTSLENHGVFAIRYPRESLKEEYFTDVTLNYGDWINEYSNSNETTLVSYGPDINKIISVVKDEHKKVTIYNAVYLHPILEKNIENLLNYKKIIIIDSYSIRNGFVDPLISLLTEKGYKGEFIVHSIPNVFVDQGTIDEQKKDLGLTLSKIIKSI